MRYTYSTHSLNSNVSIRYEVEFDTTSPSEVAMFERLHSAWTCGMYDAKLIAAKKSEPKS